MILRHMIDIDETLKLTQRQGHILRQSNFESMKMCICDKQARLTYLRGVNVLVESGLRVQLYFGQFLSGQFFCGRRKLVEVCTLVTDFFCQSKLVKQRGERAEPDRKNAAVAGFELSTMG